MKLIIHIKKLTAKSYKLKAILSAFRNLKPKTYNSFEPEGSQSSSSLSLSETNVLNGLKPNNGFTLIETLVAISILMVAVASPLTIAQKGLASAIYAKDQLIASYLAQDAIEYIVNASGKNVDNGALWLNEIEGDCGTGCRISTDVVNFTASGAIENCGGSCPDLKYDSSSRIYGHISGSNSTFNRSVKVKEIVADVEALITVTMSWKDKGTNRTLVFYTRIFNWKS